MSFECSVVIPTYNAAPMLDAQLAALSGQVGGVEFEVIVADNGSTDALGEVVERWTSSLNVRAVDASARRGPSAARNIGAAASAAPFLLFCDADDIARPTWVSSLVAALHDQPFVGGSYHPFATRDGIWLPAFETSALPTAWEDLAYTFGGNFGMRAETWRSLGGFDESLTGAEEIEFAWRARAVGVVPAFVPDAVMDYRIRPSIRGRLWHEYNSGRGTTLVAMRVRPDLVPSRSWRGQARHVAMLAARFPRGVSGRGWAAWAATLAFEAGTRRALRHGQPS